MAPAGSPSGEERERAVLGRAAVEAEELELVGLGHSPVELVLVDDHAVGPLGLRLCGVAPARAFDVPELLRPEVADERLVRRVGESVVERPEGRGEPVEQSVPVGSELAGRLRAVANEVGRVREDERAGMDSGAAAHADARLSSQVVTLSTHSVRHTCVFERYARA